MTTLSHQPDWQYLLRDVTMLYREGPAGGSKKIRSHQREVSAALTKVFEDDPAVRTIEPTTLPVCAHLSRALANAEKGPLWAIGRALSEVAPRLQWLYGYDKVPRGLSKKYAFAEILGSKGPVESERVVVGVVLFAPKTTYPAHSHKGITESSYCISGHTSENDTGVTAPGSLIFNPPGQMHRITTADREPCLLLYAWTGPKETLMGQKLSFSRT